MSSSLAIAAVTAALRNLLLAQVPRRDSSLQDLEVSTQPLDLVRKGANRPAQLNLYLYQTVPNPGWSNMDMPRQVRPGEVGSPPLALNLRYLLTAYGRGESENDVINHRVLGGAVAVLHDHPLLDRSEIADALQDSGLAEQFERLRVTPMPLSTEELSKLWAAFQSNYRVSAVYEVTVVLIDSARGARAAPPVIRRGKEDRGPSATTGATPVLKFLRMPNNQPAARLGEDIRIVGERLPSENAVIRFVSMRHQKAAPVPLVEVDLPATASAKADELIVHLPNSTEDAGAIARWSPGFYTLALASSNAIAFALAPLITVTPQTMAAGTINLQITCTPRIAVGQHVLLILGDRTMEPTNISTPADATLPTTASFVVPEVAAGTYLVRLRVDGVDSNLLILSKENGLPIYDPKQMVTVT